MITQTLFENENIKWINLHNPSKEELKLREEVANEEKKENTSSVKKDKSDKKQK